MGGHHHGQAANAGAAQKASDPALGWPAVEEHGRASRVLDQGGVALPDVEERDREPPGGRRRSNRPRKREGRDGRAQSEQGTAASLGEAPPGGRRRLRPRLEAGGGAEAGERRSGQGRVGGGEARRSAERQ